MWNKQDFKVTAAYLVNTETTRIAVQSTDANTFLTRDVPGQHVDKADELKVQLVLDMVATEMDPTNAIAQTQEKLKETESELAKTREALERSSELLAGSQKIQLENAMDIEEILERLTNVEQHVGISYEEEADEESEDKNNESGETTSEEGADQEHGEDDGGSDHE